MVSASSWVLLLVMFMIAVSARADKSSQEERDTFARHKVTHFAHSLNVGSDLKNLKNGGTFAFVHAAVGIFQKKRTNGTWGYGREIMQEMLTTLHESPVQFDRVFVTLLGNDVDRALARRTLSEFNSSSSSSSPLSSLTKFQSRVYVLNEASNLYLAEFPTIYSMQIFSEKLIDVDADADSNNSNSNARILYIHTKGMRNAGKYSPDWRRYALYFLATRYSDFCEEALVTHATCGVQLQVSQSKILRCLRVHCSVLVGSCFMWSGALDSSGVLLLYSIVSLA